MINRDSIINILVLLACFAAIFWMFGAEATEPEGYEMDRAIKSAVRLSKYEIPACMPDCAPKVFVLSEAEIKKRQRCRQHCGEFIQYSSVMNAVYISEGLLRNETPIQVQGWRVHEAIHFFTGDERRGFI